ncbi:MAG: HAMP domain-containing sensor histidine kinase, partial [Candidatus Methanoperedens sp.]|nr:HAMP domain-containing sensor histidine kinase [Candidatus Methanoperedens sp.]
NSIIGFSVLLQDSAMTDLDEKQLHYLDNVITSSKFLLSLINDILDLSKVEAGKIELVIEKVSLPDIMNETLSLIKEKAMKNKVKLKQELESELISIDVDPQRFKQIMFNLLSNAVKFSKPEGGTITIKSEKEKDMVKISVSDTGIGIREEDKDKLFKEFEQLDSGITKKYGGTGLGLAISKKLVELHGGSITVESKFGIGTTFTFTFPIKL